MPAMAVLVAAADCVYRGGLLDRAQGEEFRNVNRLTARQGF